MPKFTVLIIEDEKNIQTFMGKVLKKHDYRVLCADTGLQGLEIINSQCPDIILLDLGLPDMDGGRIIQEVRTWTSTPIIVISARTAEREKVSSLDLGADDYITKPFGTSAAPGKNPRFPAAQQSSAHRQRSVYPSVPPWRHDTGLFKASAYHQGYGHTSDAHRI